MKTFTVKRKSWHYKLVKEFGISGSHNVPNDICSYLRSLVKGMFLFLTIYAFLIGLMIVAAKMGIEMLMGVAFSIYYQQLIFTDAGFAGVLLFGLALTSFTVVTLSKCVSERSYRVEDTCPEHAGFIRTAYQSIKGKYCIKLDFK